MTTTGPQPDQDVTLWSRYAAAYEATFEPLTNGFAAAALDELEPLRGLRLLDVCAGTGGAALEAARRGAVVTAIDAAPAMVERTRERAAQAGRAIDVRVSDAMALACPDASFDAVLSCFGVVLLPDPVGALREIDRVLAPGGRVAIVTWTEPEAYELVSRLRAAVLEVTGEPPRAGPPPAQLRYVAPAAFRTLMIEGGFADVTITRVATSLDAPSARALGAGLAFAPGLAAMLDALGVARDAIVERFVRQLQRDQGEGAVALGAVAHVAHARRAP